MTTRRLRRSGARQSALTASLLLAVSLLASGCGQESDEAAGDPAGQASSEPTPTLPTEPTPTPTESAPTTGPGEGPGEPIQVTGGAGVTAATLLSRTEGGGRVETLASPLTTEVERADFVSQLDPDLAEAVLVAVEDLPDDGSLPYGTVAAIGCDAPTAVAVEAGEAGYEVEPQLPKKTVQCFAPVTFVVVFSTPAA